MKKLLIAVAIVCAAAFTQAASVKWTANNIQGQDVVTPAEGWYVELYASSVTYDFKAALAGVITATDFTTTTKNTNNGWINFSKIYNGGYEVNDAFEFYAVIYNADSIANATYYIVSDVKSGSIPSTGADATLSFGNMAAPSNNMFANSEWQAVPEPTSGLLLLLGMGALALRRKRV